MRDDLLREIVLISSEVSLERIMLSTHAAAGRLIFNENCAFTIDESSQVHCSLRSTATSDEREIAHSLARVATLAIENSRSSELKIRLQVDAERFRIARDLHDRVLQRIFATGMSLEGALRKAIVDDVITALKAAIIDLNETVGEIRTTVYSLKGSKSSLRKQLLTEIERTRLMWSTPVDFNIEGPVDTLIESSKYGDIIAVTAELLNNAGRHGDGERIKYNLSIEDQKIVISVKNGAALQAEIVPGEGLKNCSHRSNKYGGAMVVENLKPGLHVLWNIPL